MPAVRTLLRRAAQALAASAAAPWVAGAPAAGADAASDGAASGRLADVVVSAFRIPVLLESLSYSVELIPRSELDARQSPTVADALRTVPGLHVDRLGGPGGVANVYLRGSEPNHTLVLIDGVPVNDPNDVRGGSYDLSMLLTDDVERIEVLRGARSAAFGADAMGGVINVVTSRGSREPRASARMAAGGHGLRAASAAASTRALAFSAARRDDGTIESGSRARTGHGSASVSLAPTDVVHARVSARSTSRRSESFPQASGGPRLARLRELERRRANEDLVALDAAVEPRNGPRWTVRLAAYDRDDATDSPGVAAGPGGFVPASVADSRLTRRLATVAASFDRLPLGGALSLGIEAVRERGNAQLRMPMLGPNARGYRLERDIRSGFAELRVEPLRDLLAVLSVRHDDVSGLAAVSSRSIGLRHRLSENTTLRANWSEGFKPPSFFALGHPLVGNPALLPERSRTIEAGIDRRLGRDALLSATAFSSRYSQLIDFDAPSFRMVNRQRVSVDGVEVALRLAATARTTIDAAYTRVRYESGTAEPLRNRPRNRLSLQATARPDDATTIHASVFRVGATADFSVPTGAVTLAGYTRADLAWRHRANRHLTLEAAIDNVADRRHEAFIGFADPGRRLRVGVRIEN